MLGNPSGTRSQAINKSKDISNSESVVFDVVPVARLEGFRALKSSSLEAFRALKPYYQIGGF